MNFTRRTAVFATICALLLVGVSSLISYSLATNHAEKQSQESDAKRTVDLRAGCERSSDDSVARLHFLNDLVRINVRRVSAANSAPEREANQYAVNQYRQDRREFVNAQKDVAVAPGKIRPNGVRADCVKSFP